MFINFKVTVNQLLKILTKQYSTLIVEKFLKNFLRTESQTPKCSTK